MNDKLTPLAVLVGLCAIAVAVYFGLQAQQPGAAPAPTAAPDLTLPAGATAQPWIALQGSASSAAAPALSGAYAAATGGPLAPEQAHNRGTFVTAWRPQRQDAARQCELDKFVTLPKERWFLELPLELRITADGIIVGTKRFAQLREVGSDGGYAKSSLNDGAVDTLTACYAKAVATRVRFPPATAAGTLKVWVRIASNAP